MEKIKIYKLMFSQTLGFGELQCLRGAVNKLLAYQTDATFHNHTETGLRYSYPLVQYKSVGSQTMIVGIGETIDILRGLSDADVIPMRIGAKEMAMQVAEATETSYAPMVTSEPNLYSLRRYIALTEKNFIEYNNLLALSDKIIFLEKIIVGNILSFFKGISYHADYQIVAAITSIDGTEDILYKGVRFKTFNLHFVSNVTLPDGIGLGKSCSVGFGTLSTKRLPEHLKKQYSNG